MNSRSSRRALLAALLACAGAACAGPRAEGPAPGRLSSEDYRLGPGDELRITVFGEEDLTGQYVVSAQGMVAFPLIGETEARGKTISEFGAALAEALRQGYVRQPNVGVQVLNYRPFFILGEVNTPGTYPYAASLTVFNAVAVAGGFSYRADQHRVFVQHAAESQEREYRLTTTTPVLPGDTIRIAERHF